MARSSAGTLDLQTFQKLVDAFAEGLEKALAPLRQYLGEMNETWHQLAAALTASSEVRSVVEPVAERRVHAAVVEAPSRRERAVSEEGESCLVPECAAPILAKQLCETHYRIMRRTVAAGGQFDPASQRPARARAASKLCREPGCTEAHYAKGLCRRHYMAIRSRIRSAERHGQPAEGDEHQEEYDVPPGEEPGLEEEEMATPFTLRSNGGDDRGLEVPLFQETEARPTSSKEALPTAEMVSRVVAQYRGGLDRVAEVLGRNKRTLMELLDRLDLMPYVTRVRKEERQRIESAQLRDRLDDLLFREKLLEDLGCLKEVDDRARFEVKMRCASLAKDSDTIEEVLQRLGSELKLDDGGMKRLIWRYDLRRHLRGLKLRPASPPPLRTRV